MLQDCCVCRVAAYDRVPTLGSPIAPEALNGHSDVGCCQLHDSIESRLHCTVSVHNTIELCARQGSNYSKRSLG